MTRYPPLTAASCREGLLLASRLLLAAGSAPVRPYDYSDQAAMARWDKRGELFHRALGALQASLEGMAGNDPYGSSPASALIVLRKSVERFERDFAALREPEQAARP